MIELWYGLVFKFVQHNHGMVHHTCVEDIAQHGTEWWCMVFYGKLVFYTSTT